MGVFERIDNEKLSARKVKSHEQKQAMIERKFELKQQKRREKHMGH